MGIYLTYEAGTKDNEYERFFNKEKQFSIAWYKDIKGCYNHTMERQVEIYEKMKKERENQKKTSSKGKKR